MPYGYGQAAPGQAVPPGAGYGYPQAGQPQPGQVPYGQAPYAQPPQGQAPYAQPAGAEQPGQQVFSAIDQHANAAYAAAAQAFGQQMVMPTPPGTRSIDEICASGYRVDIGAWMSEGWQLAKGLLGPMIGFLLVVGVIQSITFGLAGLVMGPLMAGAFIVALRTLKGRPQPFGAFFHGFKAFLPLFLYSLVAGLLIGLGSLLIIPGIYLGVAWCWSTLLIVDRGMDFWPAMAASMKVVNKNFWGTLAWLLVSGLLGSAGALACGFGLLVTLPWAICMQVVAYKHIFGLNPGPDCCET